MLLLPALFAGAGLHVLAAPVGEVGDQQQGQDDEEDQGGQGDAHAAE